ncbi:hypothetical protein Rhal01_00667 [Rubritalea halochordaticola]|uniref:LTD domain-containing protein n=1 Tax=Rubritalea halochordaticola TaxID=714537 RepID=A0ABP9UVR2_9BACT
MKPLTSFSGLLGLMIFSVSSISWADPVISEFLASNDSELADEDGEFSDWIEIYNPDSTTINLGGWHLTDNATNLDKWTFPSTVLPAGGYLIVFASDKDRAVSGSELHTGFKLSSGGEYLALVKPDGTTKTSEFNPFPAQSEDVSYGLNTATMLVDSNATLRYTLTTPAPTWTNHDFDDSSWLGARSSDVGVVITECDTGSPDAVEIQNVSDSSVNTSGWYLVFGAGTSGNINDAEEFLAFLPSSIGAGGIQVYTENTGSLGNIAWDNAGARGWTMLCNNAGEVMDFVVWGYTEAELRTFNLNTVISSQSVQVTYTDIPWSGTPRASGNSTSNKIIRTGSRDSDTDNEWSFSSSATLGSQNSNISIPFTSFGQTRAQAGIGYEVGSGYENVLLTNLDTDTTQLWARFDFNLSDPSDISALTLKLRYDDGFQAFINGVSVANANDTNTSAGESGSYVDFDLSSYIGHLRTGNNVLAIRLINQSATSSDMLLLPELHAAVDSGSGNYTYLSEPSPGAINQGGAVNPGPIISEVTENPPPLTDSQNLTVTAHVQARNAAVNTVTLKYRVDYGSEVSLTMVDNGTNGDSIAGDGIYAAIIPASASGPGDMLRWTVIADDIGGEESRMPMQVDNTGNSQSPEYYGTVIAVQQSGAIPVMYWFTQNESASRTRTGARASVYYSNKFYDNIYVRQRGGATNNRSQKFDFNKGFPLYINADMPSVGEVNMNANGADSSYVRQTVGFNFFQEAGNAGCESFPVELKLNGTFDRVSILIEQVDEDYLKRNGYDDEGGELYKFVQRSNLNPGLNDATTGVERKTGDKNDLSSVVSFTNDLKQTSSTARIYSFYDNMDVQQFTNYMAVRSVLQLSDDVRKNFYMYKDAAGDGRWRMLPWDLDWSLGIVGSHGATRVEHPFFGTQDFPTADGANQWNRLYDVAFEDIEMQRMYLRRIRTLMDTHVKTSSTGSWFENRVDEIYYSMAGLSGPSSSGYSSLRNTEIPERRNDLHNQFTVSISGMSVVIPGSQPTNPNVVIDAVDYNPAGGDQDQEYIRLTNSESTEIDISGWSISSGVEFIFPAGTVIPRNGTLYVSPKLDKFVTRTSSPTGNEKRLVTGPYAGHLSSFGEDLILKNERGETVQTYNYSGNPSDAQRYLVVSEFLYNSPANPNAEFIEITNISTTETVSLTGVHFSDGIEFSFTGSSVTSLLPGKSVLVVKDRTAFEAAYGTGVSSLIAGEFTDGTSLNNGGEKVKLDDSTNSTIQSFTYMNTSPWPLASGSSLLLQNPSTRPDHNIPTNWAAGNIIGGTPAGASYLFDAWLTARGETDPLAIVDGWSEMASYALGRDIRGSDFTHTPKLETLNIDGSPAQYLTLETNIRNLGNTYVVPQVSTDLDFWDDAILGVDIELMSDSDNGDGTNTRKWRLSSPASPAKKQQFMRLRVLTP